MMSDRFQPGSQLIGKAWTIVITYAVMAGLWILFSDELLGQWLDNPAEITRFQTFKGWGFVAVTSLVLLVGLLNYTREYSRQLLRIAEQRAELRLLSQFQQSIIDNASIWINVLDTSANATVWNKAAEQISGYTRDEVLGNPNIWEWLYPDQIYRAEVTQTAIDILNQGNEVEGFETSIRTKGGEDKIISWNSRRFFDEQGKIVGSIAIGQDITARKQVEHTLVERERQLATLLANLPGMAYRCLNDEHWTMKFVSDGCQLLTGYAPADLLDNRNLSYASIIHEDDRLHVMSEVQQALAENRRFAVEYRIQRNDGQEAWVWEQGQEVWAWKQGNDMWVDSNQYREGIIIDITKRKTMEHELELLATRDALTGLYNRRELGQQFREELIRAQRYDRPLSLLWIDVDHFKEINDRFGHRAGDEVLRQLGQLVESSVRTVDYAARYGGEELAVVLPEMEQTVAMEMAKRLRRVVEDKRMVI
ncbi:MAG: diguanylate cyclase, partial [Gammaproteobacteria bacterium]